MEKLLSVKGKPILLHDSYIYTVERTAETKLILRCKKRDCKARCHTNLSMDAFVSQPTSHCHAPQPDHIPAIKLHNQIKARSATTNESSSSILHSALRTYPLSAAGQLPKTESLVLTIRRQRTAPKVDADGHLPEEFILHEDKHLTIFTTKNNLSILKQNKHWFADGTFKVCPDDYYQLFTLHAMMTNAIIPLVYRLLIGRKHKITINFSKNHLNTTTSNPPQ